jgi:mannose-6-phosphate isomerase
MPARPGMTIVVPAGTPHAIGAGILLYEIQQPSNVTFRLDDWGRTDDRGVPRALHLESGLAAIDRSSRPEPAPRVTLREDAPRRELLAATRYFALERIALGQGEHWILPPAGSPSVLTCLSGSGLIESDEVSERLQMGQTAIVPVSRAATIRARQRGVFLRGWVPDLDHEVIAPALEAGASHEEIARLGIAAGA